MAPVLSWYPSQEEFDVPSTVSLPKFEGFLRVNDLRMSAADFATLAKGESLDDNVLYFFMEFLRTHEFADHKNQIKILSPSFIHLFSNSNEALQREMISPRELTDIKIIITVVYNDEHWSLLALQLNPGNLPAATFFHIDSIQNKNRQSAFKLAQSLRAMLGLYNCGFHEMAGENIQDQDYNACGIFVLDQCYNVLQSFRHGQGLENLFDGQKKFKSISRRSHLAKIIQLLANDRDEGRFLAMF
jgi:Ulp1 family protease